MGALTTLNVFLNNLEDLLSAAFLSQGVNVLTAPVADPALLGPEHIVFAFDDVTDNYSYKIGTPMQRVSEEYLIPGYCVSLQDIVRDERVAYREARRRACEIFTEIINQLSAANVDKPTTQAILGVDDARITQVKMLQTINDEPFARVCQIHFVVRVQADFVPTIT
jgi:hypothetical protein